MNCNAELCVLCVLNEPFLLDMLGDNLWSDKEVR